MRGVMASKRYWIGPLFAVILFVVAYQLPPLVMFALTFVAIGLIMDAGTAWWGKNAARGGMNDYRQ
jgi:hypothetical protein